MNNTTIIANPGALQTIALAVYAQESFYTTNTSIIPFLNLSSSSNPQSTVIVPIVDLLDPIKMKDISNFGNDPNNYIFGLVESLSIKPIEAFKEINTNTYSDFIAQVKSDNFLTQGSIKLPLLIPNSDNYNFYYLIWQLGVFYFLPFFIYTSVTPINLGAPLFVENFTIHVEESSPVSIEIDFIGGITLIPPDYIQGPNWSNSYRLAKVYDCLAVCGVNDTSGTLQTDIVIANSLASFNFNLKSMSLKIKNKIKREHTANTVSTKLVSDGVRYLSLEKRKVSGSFEFLASQDLLLIYSNPGDIVQQLTLYFSGPFYFQMQNVYIDYFGSEVSGDGDGYFHKLEFNAYIIPVDLDNPGDYLSYYEQNEFVVNVTTQLGPTKDTGIPIS